MPSAVGVEPFGEVGRGEVGAGRLIPSDFDVAAATSDAGAATLVYERRSGSAAPSPSSGRGKAVRASAASAARYSVWATTIDPGKRWSKPVQLSPQGEKICGLPTVARSHTGAGPIVAQWSCYRGQARVTVMASVLSGSKWSKAMVVADLTNPADDPGAAVTVSESGIASVVWTDNRGTDGIRIQRRTFQSGTWGSPTTLLDSPNTGSANPLFPTHLAPISDAANDLLVPIFRRPNLPARDLDVDVVSTGGGVVKPPSVLASNPDRTPSFVQLGARLGGSGIRMVADGTGRIVAVWTDVTEAGYQTENYTLMLSERSPDGQWTPARPIGRPLGCAGCRSYNFALASNWRGDVALMWPEQAPSEGSVYRLNLKAITRTPDGIWSEPELIVPLADPEARTGNTCTGSDAPLFMDASGRATLTWYYCRDANPVTGRPKQGCVVTESTRTAASG